MFVNALRSCDERHSGSDADCPLTSLGFGLSSVECKVFKNIEVLTKSSASFSVLFKIKLEHRFEYFQTVWDLGILWRYFK